MINTVFINIYGKYGVCQLSQEVFNKEKEEGDDNIVLWNAMITTYTHHNELRIFQNLFLT